MADPWAGVEAVRRIGRGAIDTSSYRESVLALLRRRIGFDHHVWVLTDPVTCVGAAPHATLPGGADLPSVIRARYLTSDLRWTTVDATARLAATPSLEPDWRSALSGLGVTDVLTSVHRDDHGCWAFLDLWRCGGRFAADDQAMLEAVRTEITSHVRRLQAQAVRRSTPGGAEGSGVIVVDDDLRVVGDTARATTWLSRLLPPHPGHDPVPAIVLNAAAQLVAVEHGVDAHEPMTRVHAGNGLWLTARAERLGGGAEPRVAVTLTPTTAAERREVYARAFALSSRETELLHLFARGRSTREVADSVHLSEYTVQDHLKSVFDKTGCRTRAALVAQACGTSGNPLH